MTVTGEIPVQDLGVVLAHEHIICDAWKIEKSYDPILDDEAVAIDELLAFREAGGSTVVDCTTIGLGRDAEALPRISARSGVNIVAGTGWYRERVYPEYVKERSTRDLANFMVRDLTVGIEETSVKAGIIGEIGTERGYISPAEERVFRAAAFAHSITGSPIWTHTTHFGELALEQVSLLKECGVPGKSIVVSHLGDRIGVSQILPLAEQGVYLGIDNIGYIGGGYPSDDVRASNVMELLALGLEDAILLSGDVYRKSHLLTYGGKGYGHVQTSFLPRLRVLGASENQVSKLVTSNPTRVLARMDESIDTWGRS